MPEGGATRGTAGLLLGLPAPARLNGLAHLDARAPMMQVGAPVPAPDDDGPRRDPLASSPNWRGASRDAWYFLSYQVVGVGVLYLAPESFTGWTDEDKENYNFVKWRDNVANPVWDDDVWYVNYILHPYWGSAYYIRARERGLSPTQAFWYSAILSAMWEYGAEALAEPVSIQDLIVTPVFGALVGQYVVTPWRIAILSKPGELHWSDRVVLVLTDPLGAINQTVGGWFGVKTTLQLRHSSLRSPAVNPDPLAAAPHGLSRRPPGGWRVEMRLEW